MPLIRDKFFQRYKLIVPSFYFIHIQNVFKRAWVYTIVLGDHLLKEKRKNTKF